MFLTKVTCIHFLISAFLQSFWFDHHDIFCLDLWRPPWTLRCHPIGGSPLSCPVHVGLPGIWAAFIVAQVWILVSGVPPFYGTRNYTRPMGQLVASVGFSCRTPHLQCLPLGWRVGGRCTFKAQVPSRDRGKRFTCTYGCHTTVFPVHIAAIVEKFLILLA